MKTRFQLITVTMLSSLLLLGGCVSKSLYEKCALQNDHANERINKLLAEQANRQLGAEGWKQRYELCLGTRQGDVSKIRALEAAIAAKNAIIEQLAPLVGQVALPAELSNALNEWAAQTGSDLVTYDEKRGIVRFKSDLLFNKGEVAVQPEAQRQLKALSKILNSSVAEGFDILIVGHTDNIPILKPGTLAKHPTNWHLSAHRAIAVEKVFELSGTKPARLAVIGMGKYRPIQPNKPGKKGNPKNRRVEIYIVPAGQIHFTGSTRQPAM